MHLEDNKWNGAADRHHGVSIPAESHEGLLRSEMDAEGIANRAGMDWSV